MNAVPAVVHEDVDDGDTFLESSPEAGVPLVPDEDLGELVLVALARGLQVDSEDATTWAEVVPPHLEAAAAVNADLDDVHVTAHEFGEVAVVDVEVVEPLPDATPGTVTVEEIPERVRRMGPASVLPRPPGVVRRALFPTLRMVESTDHRRQVLEQSEAEDGLPREALRELEQVPEFSS
jgi:hypothetical protein